MVANRPSPPNDLFLYLKKHPVIWLWLVAILLVASVARLSVWPPRTTEDGVIFHGPDSNYHARRAYYSAEHFPKSLNFDHALQHPKGQLVPWPPLYDLTLGSWLRLWRSQAVDDFGRDLLLAVTPLLFTWITFLFGFFVLSQLYAPRLALATLSLLALLPIHVDATMYGNIDHHLLDPIVIFWLLWVNQTLNSVKSTSPRQNILLGVTTGLWLGFSQSIAIYLFLYAAWLAYLAWRGQKVRLHVLSIAAGAAIIAGYGTLHDYPVLSYQSISWLHPLLLLFPASVPASRTFKKKPSALLIPLTYFSLLLMIPDLRQALFGGGHFLAGNPVIQLISESQPLWNSPTLPLGLLGYLSFILPLMFLSLIPEAVKAKDHSPLFALLLAVALMFLTFLQIRFGISLAIFLCLIPVLFFETYVRRYRLKSLSYGIIILIATLLNALPFNLALLSEWRYPPTPNKEDMFEITQWLAKRSDSNGSVRSHPEQPARYSILSHWQLGHEIIQRADRAVIVNPFIFDVRTPGLQESLKWLYEFDDQALHDFANAHQVAYLVAAPRLGQIHKELKILGANERHYLTPKNGKQHLTHRLKQSFFYRLGFLPDQRLAPLPHLRLRYETPLRENALGFRESRFKIYQIVPGALVQGRAAPNQEVRFAIKLRSNRHRIIQSEWTTQADPQGRFALRLPYGNDLPFSYESFSVAPEYQVTGLSKKTLVLREADVWSGATVKIR